MTITISKADATALLAGTPVSIQLATAAPPPPPPPPPPPATGTDVYKIYSNGVYYWPGDYNSGATSDYRHVGDALAPNTMCLKLAINSPWGEWLAYSHANPGPFLDISKVCNGKPATRLQFKLKATRPNQQVSVYVISANDVPPPPSVPGYISAPGVFPVGTWVTQTLLLASLGVGPGLFTGNLLYKFGMQDKSGATSNILYVDDVFLLP